MINKTLPSGKELRIGLAPFADAKALYKALASELRGVSIGGKEEVHDAIKNGLFTVISSDLVESALWKCMERCLLNNQKITPELFEDVKNRGDYLLICYEVTKENVLPFVSPLWQEFSPILEKLKAFLK